MTLVTFRLGGREYATALDAVREVVRLEGLAELPGMAPPLAGVVDLRGTALPVLDLRLGDRSRRDGGSRGDVLVLQRGDGAVGVAVDQVRAVVAASDLARTGGGERGVLPSYVVDVLRGPDGQVFLVDLERMVDSARLPVSSASAQGQLQR